MYIFYETFRYDNNTRKVKSITYITNKVTCYQNVMPESVMFADTKSVSYCERTGKLYVRERARRAVVRYSKETIDNKLQLLLCSRKVENYIMNIYKGDIDER